MTTRRSVAVSGSALRVSTGLAATVLALAIPGVTAAAPVAVAAATCPATVTITEGVASLTLTPADATVAAGQCVTFSNQTATDIALVVGAGAAETITATSSVDYVATTVGTYGVTATQQLLVVTLAAGDGTLEVTAGTSSPSASASPSHSGSSSASPRPSRSHSSPHGSADPHGHGHGRSGSSVPPLVIPPGETSSPYAVQHSAKGISPLLAGSPSPGTQVVPTPGATSSPRASGAAASSGGSWNWLLALAALLALLQLVALGWVVVDGRRRDVGGSP